MGYKLLNFCEFDKYAIKSYCAVHGVDESLNLGDITEVDEKKLPQYDMICGGSPCFTAGTMVYTENGNVPIEQIDVGDYVLTHKNRYMAVERIGGEKDRDIWCMNAMGFLDIFATGNHPFYIKKSKNSSPEKVFLSDINNGFYVSRPINNIEIDDDFLTEETCWILGRYVADGHIRYDKRKNRNNSYQYGVILSIGETKVDDVCNKLKEHHATVYKHTKSVYRVVINNKEMVEYILSNDFGRYAYEKRIPKCIQNLPINKLKAFLDGYLSGDGSNIKQSGLYSITTVSECLANDLCDVVQKVHRVGCRVYKDIRKKTCEIEGRIVNQRDTYIIRFIIDKNRKHHWFEEDDKIWYPVRCVTKTELKDDVYNIEVSEDHTYIANGAVVYNCQDFSVAGKQAGSMWKCTDCGHEYNPITVHYDKRDSCPSCSSKNIDKTRSSLLVEWLRIVRENHPKWCVYENVKNIVGKKFKDTFDLFIKELNEYGYNTHYKVLNAKDYGIPQNRERVYVICILKELDNGMFTFPEGFDNGLRLKDMLENESDVDEKFYIDNDRTKVLIDDLLASGKLDKEISNSVRGGGAEAV